MKRIKYTGLIKWSIYGWSQNKMCIVQHKIYSKEVFEYISSKDYELKQVKENELSWKKFLEVAFRFYNKTVNESYSAEQILISYKDAENDNIIITDADAYGCFILVLYASRTSPIEIIMKPKVFPKNCGQLNTSYISSEILCSRCNQCLSELDTLSVSENMTEEIIDLTGCDTEEVTKKKIKNPISYPLLQPDKYERFKLHNHAFQKKNTSNFSSDPQDMINSVTNNLYEMQLNHGKDFYDYAYEKRNPMYTSLYMNRNLRRTPKKTYIDLDAPPHVSPPIIIEIKDDARDNWNKKIINVRPLRSEP